MEFRNQRIKSGEKSKWSFKKIFWLALVLLIVYYVFKFVAGGADIKQFVLSFGAPLQADSDGRTNFLLVGTGGEMHEGSDLTDSILVASLDSENKSATLLSLPIDLYVSTKINGEDRINKIFTLAKNKFEDSGKAMEILTSVVEDVVGEEIHYYVKVNFEGFAEVIDMIDGVDMYIEETIDDPFYPLAETIGYEPFYLGKGIQHLDGETALKYARSRKTTSDFDRSHRQQQLLFAIKDKIAEENIAKNPDKIKDIFFGLKNNIETNLSLRELIQLAEVGKEINEANITTYILHDDPSQCGGFLYTPARDFYGGAFVLIPASDPFNPDDNYIYLNFFTKEILGNPEIGSENIEIQVLNGTKAIGLAGQTKVLLKRNCFNVYRFGNARELDLEETKIYAKTEKALNSKTIKVLRDYLEVGEITANVPQKYYEEQYLSDAEIVIELGEDYADNPNVDPYDYLIDIATYYDEEEISDEATDIEYNTSIETPEE
ncbi:LCP family protein [Patescibacteria group bacterium]|nr:LCP family protein [Patescibacteria group bacterium]